MRNLLAGALALAIVSAAQAQIKVTEIWAGGLSGAEATSDWFELTNFGATAVSASGWFYDDDSADPTADDPILGLTSIAAGESVIVLTSWEDDWATAADAIGDFTAQWNVGGSLTGVAIGYVDGGGGLGSSSDAVYVFDSNLIGANTIASQGYSTDAEPESFVSQADGSWPSDQLAQVGVLGAYASNFPASDGLSVPAIGSPGVVPEPASLALLSLALLAIRRR